jgi:dipeptidyl aminopeptidase/acylaminoacyl peptidase
MSRLVVAVTALAALVAFAAAPAQATFPGRNGGIAFGQHTASGDSDPVITEHSRLLVALPPFGRDRIRTLLDCQTSDGVPSGGDCTAMAPRAPSYSRNGERIVVDAGERLAIIDADGGEAVLLPAATADDGDPCFSPDGKRVAFTGVNERGGTDLYVRTLDSGATRTIILDAGAPAWSSRNRLAYVRSGNVYTSDPNGRARRWVTSGVSPDWSPHGSRLALVRPLPELTFDGLTGRMYTVAANGRDLRRVGRSRDASNPVWSPDGRWLAYDGFDLGVNVKRIGSAVPAREIAPTQFSGESGSIASFQPAWRPR